MNEFDIFKDSKLGVYQLRTKSTSFSISFDDESKEDVFKDIASLLKDNEEYSLSKLKRKLEKRHEPEKIMEVLYLLNDNFLLPLELSVKLTEANSSNNPVYIPNNFRNLSNNYQSINICSLLIIGCSPVSKLMVVQAEKMGFKEIKSLSFSGTEKEMENKMLNADFIIVDGNEWSPYHIGLINKLAIKHNKPWLYVGGIEEDAIKVGPIFYGKETGCYNCLISRIKSNHEYPEYFDSYENYLKDNRLSSKPDKGLIHFETLHSVTANIALLETSKFIEGWSISSSWRTIIKFNYYKSEITKHTLLKKPYCKVCKPEIQYNSAPWLEAITLK